MLDFKLDHYPLGVHVDIRHPHVDLHVPFGFVRVGWYRCPTITTARAFGYQGWRKSAAREMELVKARLTREAR